MTTNTNRRAGDPAARKTDLADGSITSKVIATPPKVQGGALVKRSTCQLEILALRSLELADRVAAGEIAFLDAVDLGYEAAVWSGLTETVGDDIVQATLAAAFANARRPT
jgi:hypothetical protein